MSTNSNSSNADENYDINEKTIDEEEDDESDYGSMCNCDLCYMSREIYEYMHESREKEDDDPINECIENEEMKKEDAKQETK